jgi:hypothetical protein
MKSLVIIDVMNTSGSSDTSRAAERMLFDLARQAPAWRKVEIMGEMYRTVCELALSGLRDRYPHSPPSELRRRLADILLGTELALRAYGPFPGN